MNITYFHPDFGTIKVNPTASYYEQLRSRLTVKKVVGKNFVRIGKHNDGGYITVDNFQNSGVAYSFGICDDVSWDADMAAHGYEIFMYDPTIDALPATNPKFHFFREGIAGTDNPKRSLNTPEHFVGANGFHELTAPKDQSVMNATLACLSKINRTHSLVHLHANNSNPFIILDDKILIPDVLELTYVKTANYQLADDEDILLPLPIDEPNSPVRQDIPLGFWNRRFNNVLAIK